VSKPGSPLHPEEAWRRLESYLAKAAPLPSETAPRGRAFLRVLAREVAATTDVPTVDVSAMDGFALTGEPPAGARLPVDGMVTAGDRPGARLVPGRALRIMTGAPVPEGADRVVPVELTDTDGRGVLVRESPAPGAHIRRRGEVVRCGAPLLAAGTLLTPGALALLATHGIGELPVVARPRLAVLATGNEVVPPETEPEPGQVRDSHTDFFLAAAASLGCAIESLGIAPDDASSLREHIEPGLESDVLLLTGGVSMGELDLVEGVLAELGCRPLFDAVAIQPGKPVVAAVHPGGLVFGLPGNPASAMVTFWLFVRPVLRRLMGHEDRYWHGALRARLAATLPGAKSRDRFLPAEIEISAGEIHVRPVPPAGSHDVAAYGLGTALVRIPANAPQRDAGGECEILPLVNWPLSLTEP
jgi:molybdopterin molybdotransferase